MNAEQLSKVGSDLVRRCGTRDPFRIANALGINVMDDCENLGSLKGMYCIVKRNRFIFLNKDLSPQMKRIVCAHEIGHDRLHLRPNHIGVFCNLLHLERIRNAAEQYADSLCAGKIQDRDVVYLMCRELKMQQWEEHPLFKRSILKDIYRLKEERKK